MAGWAVDVADRRAFRSRLNGLGVLWAVPVFSIFRNCSVYLLESKGLKCVPRVLRCVYAGFAFNFLFVFCLACFVLVCGFLVSV